MPAKRINGPVPMSDYVAQYNAQWNHAFTGLRSLIAGSAPGSPAAPGFLEIERMWSRVHFQADYGYTWDSSDAITNGDSCAGCD